MAAAGDLVSSWPVNQTATRAKLGGSTGVETEPLPSITRLVITDFRSYAHAEIDVEPRPVVLVGSNGAGKTNLLEAISTLGPGRGLRGATLDSLARHGGTRGWAVAATVQGKDGSHRIGAGTITDSPSNSVGARRQVRIDGELAPGPRALAEVLQIVWLTPTMDRLLSEGASPRRRFLDNLILAVDPQHGSRAGAYARAMRERQRILMERPSERAWLEALEETMAATGVALAAARCELLIRLKRTDVMLQPVGGAPSPFQIPDFELVGWVENRLSDMAAVDVEDQFRERLAESRGRDGAAGRALEGPHRTDLQVRHPRTGLAAADCSTGEQKSFVLATVLAFAHLQKAVNGGFGPLLLIDEVAAHLDEARREALWVEIAALGGQAWLTGTDEGLFTTLGDRAQFLKVQPLQEASGHMTSTVSPL